MRNPCFDAVSGELTAAGVRFTRSTRGKHEAVEFEIRGRHQFIIVPASASDRRAWLNARAHVRRVLRAAALS
jgi:hypothetical protein